MSNIQWQTEPDRLAFHGDTHYAEIFWNGSRTAKIGVKRMRDDTQLLQSDELFSSAEEMTLAVPRMKAQVEAAILHDLATSPPTS
jgi:hypothetical protein